MSAPITICVASFNTCAATELCIRSIMRLADHPYELRVGDSGSTDGSVATLERFQERGLITLERSPGSRTHADWLDHWRQTCDSKLLLFVDSDIEFRRASWLRQLVSIVRRTDPAIAYAEWLPPSLFTLDGLEARVVLRPAPWVLLIDAEQTSELRSSFAVTYPETEPIIHDVGAAFFHEAVDRGLSTLALPPSFRRCYHHYGGLSWLPVTGPRGQKKLRDQRTVERRLRHLRRLQSATSVTCRVSATAQLAAFPQDALDAMFRIRTGVRRRCGRPPDTRGP